MKLFNHYLFHQKKNDSVSNPIAAVIEENSWNIAWIVALLVSIVQCLMPQKSGHSTKRLLGKVNLAAAPHPRYIWLSHKYWLHNIFSTTTKRVLLWTIFFSWSLLFWSMNEYYASFWTRKTVLAVENKEHAYWPWECLLCVCIPLEVKCSWPWVSELRNTGTLCS